MRRSRLAILTSVALIAVSLAASAQDKSPAEDQYMAAMDRMSKEMNQASSPDPAVSFAKKMMAHHQGAIDMSEVVLQHTKDPTIRKMAEKTIKDQQKEIKDLRAWAAKKGG